MAVRMRVTSDMPFIISPAGAPSMNRTLTPHGHLQPDPPTTDELAVARLPAERGGAAGARLRQPFLCRGARLPGAWLQRVLCRGGGHRGPVGNRQTTLA